MKNVKDPYSVVALGTFSGEKSNDGIHFLPKNMTMNGTKYLKISANPKLQFWSLHKCNFGCKMENLFIRQNVLKMVT